MESCSHSLFSMSSTRRAASKPSSRPQSAKSAAEQLADTLSSKLTLQGSAGVGGKERVSQSQGIDDGPKESKTGSMRAVNAASQSLSSIVQSGWKKSTGTATTNRATLQTATTMAASALKHIRILRKLCAGDIDVERATMSVLAKLVGLEMVCRTFSYCFYLNRPSLTLLRICWPKHYPRFVRH